MRSASICRRSRPRRPSISAAEKVPWTGVPFGISISCGRDIGGGAPGVTTGASCLDSVPALPLPQLRRLDVVDGKMRRRSGLSGSMDTAGSRSWHDRMQGDTDALIGSSQDRRRDGLAGGALAVAAAPRPLVRALRHRRHLRAAAGRTGRMSSSPSAALPRLGFRGWNVTLPHKEAAFALVDERDEAARRMRAVNTVLVDAAGRTLGLQHRWPGLPRQSRRDGTGLADGAGQGGPHRHRRGRPCGGRMRSSRRASPALRLVNRTARKAEALGARSSKPRPCDLEVVSWESRAAASAEAVAARQLHEPRHARPAGARPRARRPSGRRGRDRSRLRALGDLAPGRVPVRAAIRSWTASACCCIRPCRASRTGAVSCPRSIRACGPASCKPLAGPPEGLSPAGAVAAGADRR